MYLNEQQKNQPEPMKFNAPYVIISFLFVFQSCATFQNSLVNENRIKINRDSIINYENEYSILSYKSTLEKGKYNQEKKDLIDAINRSYDNHQKSSFKSYKVKFINENTIQIQGLDSLKNIQLSYRINGKIKRNGFFNVNNKYMKCNRIPYLFGGCTNAKTRIGFSKDQELIIQNAYYDFGAVLIIFGSSVDYNEALFFKKIKKPAHNNGH